MTAAGDAITLDRGNDRCVDRVATRIPAQPCGTFSHHKREAGIARLTALGIEVSDYATMMVEIIADNTDPKADEIYAALDMPFAT